MEGRIEACLRRARGCQEFQMASSEGSSVTCPNDRTLMAQSACHMPGPLEGGRGLVCPPEAESDPSLCDMLMLR